MKKYLFALLTLVVALFAFQEPAHAAGRYMTIGYQIDCNGGWYKVRLDMQENTAKVISCPNDTDVEIPYWIYCGDNEENMYAVTSVSKNALKKCKKTKYIMVDADINCWNINLKYAKKLKQIDITSQEITKVNRSAVKNIAKKCVIKCIDFEQEQLFRRAIPRSRKTVFDGNFAGYVG